MPNLASFKKTRTNSKTQIKYGSQQEFLWKNSRTNSIKSTKYGSVENVDF